MSENRYGGWNDDEQYYSGSTNTSMHKHQSNSSEYGSNTRDFDNVNVRSNPRWDSQRDTSDSYQPVTEIRRNHQPRRGRVSRNGGDNARDFFYWFGSNGGFHALPRIIMVLAIIALVAWTIINRNAIFNGIIGLISELLPIALTLWLMWVCIKNIINPK